MGKDEGGVPRDGSLRGQVEMDTGKVEAVRMWPEPKNKHELQQFLGFANYYRQFISHFATMSCPLH